MSKNILITIIGYQEKNVVTYSRSVKLNSVFFFCLPEHITDSRPPKSVTSPITSESWKKNHRYKKLLGCNYQSKKLSYLPIKMFSSSTPC